MTEKALISILNFLRPQRLEFDITLRFSWAILKRLIPYLDGIYLVEYLVIFFRRDQVEDSAIRPKYC